MLGTLHYLLEIARHRCNYFQCFIPEHIKEFVFIGVEELSLDIQLSKQNPVHHWFSVDDISQDWVANARSMNSDLMHFSGFDFHLDERKISQDRMDNVFFIPAFRDGSFAKSFVHDGLSSLEFFIE